MINKFVILDFEWQVHNRKKKKDKTLKKTNKQKYSMNVQWIPFPNHKVKNDSKPTDMLLKSVIENLLDTSVITIRL